MPRIYRIYESFGTEDELAWAAGLFEGEGWITERLRKDGIKIPTLGLRSTDEDVLRTFHRILGMRGTINGPLAGRPANWKPIWQWLVQHKAAREVAPVLFPRLHARRQKRMIEVFGEDL